jgi:DNA invertase Pin-like site-specific DNA recombinase
MTHLVTLIEELLQRQVRFRSLCDGAIDTTTASGELVFNIFSACNYPGRLRVGDAIGFY